VADIVVKCLRCGKESTISQYAASGTVPCPSCKTPLDMPAAEKGLSRLQMRKGKADTPVDLSAEEIKKHEIPKNAEPPSIDQVQAVLSNVHKSRQKVKKQHAFLSLLSFVLVGGLLIGWQYYISRHGQYVDQYMMTRGIVIGIVGLLTLLVAFQDSTFQGLLCLLAPYTIYYVLVRMESYLIQGAAIAVFVALGTEVYFIPGHAVITHAQAGFNRFVEVVAGLVQRAGEPPGLPH
jgi:hypothetical protein